MKVGVFSTKLNPTSFDPYTKASSSGDDAYIVYFPVNLSVSKTTVWQTAMNLKNSWQAVMSSWSFTLLLDCLKIAFTSSRVL